MLETALQGPDELVIEHLDTPGIAPRLCRPLREVLVHARHKTYYAGGSDLLSSFLVSPDRDVGRMSNVIADHHCLAAVDERVDVLKRLVDAAGLEIQLDGDVGEVLVPPLLSVLSLLGPLSLVDVLLLLVFLR
jgi:hypothetical protein